MKPLCKVFVVGLIVLFGGIKLNAQGTVYSFTLNKAGGNAPNQALGIALDPLTNSYVLGGFTSPLTIGSTVLSNPGGWPNIFLIRMRVSGSPLWARAPVTDYTIANAKVCCDSKGNSYIAGTFGGTNIAFGASNLVNYASDHSGDIFLAKYDTAGTFKLLNRLGGTGKDMFGDMVADTDGNCFLTGGFQSPTFTAGNSNLVQQGAGGGDCFTARYDASGNVLWLEQGSNARGTCVALDSATNCYVGGYVIGPAVFDGQSPSNSVTTNFLAKYYYGGGLAWVRGDLKLGKFICVDPAQNIYTSGTFSNSIQMGSLTLENSAASTMFVVKYDSNGTAQWARQLPGLGNDVLTGMVLDSSTNCWISGYYASTAAPANTFAMVAQLSPFGNLNAVSQITSPQSSAGGVAATKGPRGPAVFICGSYATNFNFYHTITNTGNPDVFTAWVLAPPALTSSIASTNLVCAWPNTDTNLVLEASSDFSSWASVTNPVANVNGQNIVTNAMSGRAGFYRLRLR